MDVCLYSQVNIQVCVMWLHHLALLFVKGGYRFNLHMRFYIN